MARADPWYCLFLAKRMLPLIPRLQCEIEGARKGSDVEHIHRMRVASRRLRAALPLFKRCMGVREHRRWRRTLRTVTRALGAARDADVQIGFLLSYAARLPVGRSEAQPSFCLPGEPDGLFSTGMIVRDDGADREIRPELAPGDRPGVECLLLRLAQERERLQPAVLEALDRLEASRVLERMLERLRRTELHTHRDEPVTRSATVHGAALRTVALRIDELAAHAPALRDPTRTAEHHAMRIAAKRLRYTLETFAPLYEDELRPEVKAIKHLQELLGELHDCDVWIERLPRFLDEERDRARAYFGHDGLMRFIEPGVQGLILDRTAERGRLHAVALGAWEELERECFLERLSGRLASARDEARLASHALGTNGEET